ncbi:hypothetical protein Hdeb2414_s0003g00108281 [Helianthus debilis subsp. tardiflorus]
MHKVKRSLTLTLKRMKNAKEYLQKVPARFEPDSLSGRKHILPLRECRIRFKYEEE